MVCILLCLTSFAQHYVSDIQPSFECCGLEPFSSCLLGKIRFPAFSSLNPHVGDFEPERYIFSNLLLCCYKSSNGE